MPEIIDDKSQICIPFLLSRLKLHQAKHANNPRPPPFFLGINGVQGVGKTVLVSTLQKSLRSPPYSLPTVVLSLDDIYLTHDDQLALAASHPTNPLLRHRGQPSTHDIELGESIFMALRENRPVAIPQYDKSAFSGQGDRVPESQWETVNGDGDEKIQAVIFEGWCVGFRPLDDDSLKKKWEEAVLQRRGGQYDGQLAYVKFEDAKIINDALRNYNGLIDQLDALIHIDAENTRFVYDWRQEQERGLRAVKGTGMTEEQVTQFVNGYYPSYELFTDTLRSGAFRPKIGDERDTASKDWKGRQLRLVVDRSRGVREVVNI